MIRLHWLEIEWLANDLYELRKLIAILIFVERKKELTADEKIFLSQHIHQSAVKSMAQIIGRKGGLKGGKARAVSLTPERRKEIARKAALSRWNNSE